MRLHIEDIKKNFGEKEVLKGCSGIFEQGRIYGLLGRNVPRYEQKTLSIT